MAVSKFTSADAVISIKPTMICGAVLKSTVSAATVVLRDYTSAVPSGEVKLVMTAPVGNNTTEVMFSEPVQTGKGLYADITGVGAGVTILYK